MFAPRFYTSIITATIESSSFNVINIEIFPPNFSHTYISIQVDSLSCRPNYYSPICQPVDAITNILFSSGTTGRIIIIILISHAHNHNCTSSLRRTIDNLAYRMVQNRRTKSYIMDPTFSNSIC